MADIDFVNCCKSSQEISLSWKDLLNRRYTVKNGVLRYTLIGVVEEVLFQHPCFTSIFSRKIVVGCMLT